MSATALSIMLDQPTVCELVTTLDTLLGIVDVPATDQEEIELCPNTNE